MSETPSSSENQLPLRDRILAVPEFSLPDALKLGSEYLESNMVPPPKLDPSLSDAAGGPMIAHILSEIYEEDKEPLRQVSLGNTEPLGNYLKTEGKRIVRDELQGETTPDSISNTTFGIRLYEMGIRLSSPQPSDQ